MRASAGEEVEGSAESLSELVSFDDEVLPTDSANVIGVSPSNIKSMHTIAWLGRIRREKSV